jgi:hypothetical protein
MGQTLLAAVTSGLALAGVIAVGGMAAGRFSRGVPHIGIGGLGAAAAVVAARLPNLQGPPKLLVVAVAGALAGGLGFLVDRRAREIDAAVWPPPLLAELAVLGLALGLVGLLRPSSAIELPLGPLGGLTSTWGALAACAVGLVFALLTVAGPIGRRALAGWALAAAGAAIAVALGAGSVVVRGEVVVPAFGVPDVAGLALRAAAVGVVARRGVWPGIGAALALGIGESLLRTQFSTGEAALVPTVAVLAWSVWSEGRRAPVTAAA